MKQKFSGLQLLSQVLTTGASVLTTSCIYTKDAGGMFLGIFLLCAGLFVLGVAVGEIGG